mmetsp:Transcript_18905/g.33304  ORF Transcript_18905/g.33304 Transcript_18905/m.33304 type:complete len:345 (+) Transcript_18905:80-1114(+)
MTDSDEKREKKRQKKEKKVRKKQKQQQEQQEGATDKKNMQDLEEKQIEPIEQNEQEVTKVDHTRDDDNDDDDQGNHEDNDNDNSNTGGKRKRKRKRKRKTETEGEEQDDDNDVNVVNTLDTASAVQDTVFVEGIPFDATPDRVKEFFVTQGNMQPEDILDMRLPTWQDTGRLRGYGHVRFVSTPMYEKALTLSGKYLDRRYLTIAPSNAPGGGSSKMPTTLSLPAPSSCQTLFVNNLPYSATEQEIAHAFSKYTKTTITEDNVRIARNSVTRQSKGFAYIDFDTTEDLEAVVRGHTSPASKKKPIAVGGRAVRLDYDTGRIKGSFRTDSGRLWTKENNKKATQH